MNLAPGVEETIGPRVYHVKLLKRTCRVFSSSPGQTHSRENPDLVTITTI
jgi:hypothetical protein